MRLLKGLVIVPLLWANPLLSAEAPQRQPQVDLELEEILVNGRKPITDPDQLSAWLSRLVGEFRYEGYVERRGGTETAMDRAEVQGSSRCTNLGAPGLVQCVMNVGWQEMRGPGNAEIPGGVSWLTPAVAVYGMYDERGYRPDRPPDPQYIGHMQVDSRGLAETGLGQLYDNTLIYKSPCADLAGNCQRVVQIEAPPGGRIILMRVDVLRDSKLEARYFFQWHRTKQTLAVSDPALATVTRAGGTIMPAAMQDWTGRLAGKFRGPTFRPGASTAKCNAVKILPSREEATEAGRCMMMLSEMECLRIGSGPGVRCVRSMGWQEARVPTDSPAQFELWGYDAVAQRMVRALATPMLIRNAGGLDFGTGTLGGLLKDTLTWTLPCSGLLSDCRAIKSWVEIPPDGRYVETARRDLDGHIMAFRFTRIDSGAPADTAPETPKVRNPSPKRP